MRFFLCVKLCLLITRQTLDMWSWGVVSHLVTKWGVITQKARKWDTTPRFAQLPLRHHQKLET